MLKHTLARFFQNDLLFVLTIFLTIFIPLYPKLPLADIIPGYIVRVRLEDIFVAITCLVWLIAAIRQKIKWKTPLNAFIFSYAFVGLMSSISAVIFTHTVPAETLHVGKTLLHYFRYMEYFSLFFLTVASLNSYRRVKIALVALCITVLGVSAYGFGQRYYYWPVYSTMNREFSKGMRLYLTEHARVQSTFGGHYDLGGYLVIVLPILFALFLLVKKKSFKIALAITYTAGVWALMQSASRSSVLGFVVASGAVILVRNIFQPTWLKKITMTLTHSFFLGIFLWFMMAQFGKDLYDRIVQGLQAFPVVYTVYMDTTKKTDELLANVRNEYLEKMYTSLFVKEVPANAIPADAVEVLVASDTRPTPVEEGVDPAVNPNGAVDPSQRPKDVFVDVPDIKYVATTSAEGITTMEKVEQPRVFSQTAIDKGLSLAIRYETLWPRAMQGFYTNPLLGSGYATLTKETAGQFTEAESTDNNFLRTLGETGGLGFLAFYGTIVMAGYLSIRLLLKKDVSALAFMFAVGFVGGTTGLLVNAFYIDVFAASKVAYTYWIVVGILTALYTLEFTKPPAPDTFTHLPAAHTSSKKKKTKKKS